MIKINVDLGERAYPIYISDNFIALKAELKKLVGNRDFAIVSNKKIASLYLKKIGLKPSRLIIIPDGEKFKSLATFEKITNQLISFKLKRDSVLIAFGGGVIGDLTGFSAACYQRGIDFIQIPTTLLAQVDSSVGGKTGINHPQAKNMIGAFHQPIGVFSSIDCLSTLPKRQFKAGIAEIIKYGAIEDIKLFNYMIKNSVKIKALSNRELTYIIKKSCQIKAKIVNEDEREAGKRALLNFGHTFGHAIEHIHNYKEILHGEAVANGMLIATIISEKLSLIDSGEVERMKYILASYNLNKFKRRYDVTQLMSAILLDKKNTQNKITIILLNKIGCAFRYDIKKKRDMSLLLKYALNAI